MCLHIFPSSEHSVTRAEGARGQSSLIIPNSTTPVQHCSTFCTRLHTR